MPLPPSLGFGFPTATPHGLTSRHAADSQAHSSKGTPSHTRGALTACKHMVSGTISLPSRGTFHHSLTVLIRYRSYWVFRLTGWSRQIHSRFHGPAATREHNHTQHTIFTYGTLTHSGRPSQTTSANHATARPGSTAPEKLHPTTPHAQPLSGITHTRFSLIRVRSPLLTESLLFSLPTGTEMFHFPASTSTTTMNSS